MAMRLPRFRIAWLMVAVAIAGLNFGLIRAMLAPGIGAREDLLVVGALPMANVLVAGLLVAHQRPRSRPFLHRFELYGTMVLALYVVLAISVPHEVIRLYICPIIDPIDRRMMNSPHLVSIPVRVSVGVVLLVLPQTALALIGGFMSWRLMSTVRISRRSDRAPA
jgi:hypothetical protein